MTKKYVRYTVGVDPFMVINVGDKNEHQYRHETGLVTQDIFVRGEGRHRKIVGKGKLLNWSPYAGPRWGDKLTDVLEIEVTYE